MYAKVVLLIYNIINYIFFSITKKKHNKIHINQDITVSIIHQVKESLNFLVSSFDLMIDNFNLLNYYIDGFRNKRSKAIKENVVGVVSVE